MSAEVVVPFGDPVVRELQARRRKALEGRDRTFTRNQPVASDLDPDSCLRRQVLEIVEWQSKPKFPPEVLSLFESGRRLERAAYEVLSDMGVDVQLQQEPFALTHRLTREKVVGGKIDGVIVIPETRERRVLEIKQVPTWDLFRLEKAEDFLVRPWHRKHLAQVNLYMVGLGIERAIIMLGDGRGNWKWVPITLDLEIAERAWAFAEKVVDAVTAHRMARAGEKSLPDFTTDASLCARCPFFGRTCQPPFSGTGIGVEFLWGEEDEADLLRWHELKPLHKEWAALDKTIKAKLKVGSPLKVLGDFLVEIKSYPRKGYSVPSGDVTEVVIQKIGELGR